MNKKLIERIRVFNKIKYGTNDHETRIIIAKLKPAVDYTIVWKDRT